tara:strand:- start:327 stop:767 length:441 start_codon:yes stop_codon:yes gene_type:complete
MTKKLDCRLKINKSRKKCINKKENKSKKSKKQKQQYFFNPNNPKLSFDVYINKNPSDTISIKYTTLEDVTNTIKKLERLFKKQEYTHKRIWQVAMIMKVRLDVIKKNSPHIKNINSRVKLATKYYNFLKKRTQEKTFEDRKKLKFL